MEQSPKLTINYEIHKTTGIKRSKATLELRNGDLLFYIVGQLFHSLERQCSVRKISELDFDNVRLSTSDVVHYNTFRDKPASLQRHQTMSFFYDDVKLPVAPKLQVRLACVPRRNISQ